MSSLPIQALELHLGQGAVISPKAQIRGLNGPAKRIVIGDYTYIGDDVQIICDDFQIGDYAKIQHHTNIHGYQPCHIGHNAWIGQYSIIDSIGGCEIGHNCGIGAHSQLWSHIRFGDTLEGCRFDSRKSLSIGHDVWFVGHCIVSPIRAEDRSMAMVGSVITKDMAYNEIYAGSPAKSLSDRIGYQFEPQSLETKMVKMQTHLRESGLDPSRLRIVPTEADMGQEEGISYFAVDTRRYRKWGHEAEVAFMRYLLPTRAKFIPLD